MKARIVTTVLSLSLVTSCSASPLTDDQLEVAATTWSNQLGLVQESPAVWERRLDEACSEGVWKKSVALELASQYLDVDAGLSRRSADIGPVSIETAADTLWLIAIQVCRDRFPSDAIGHGPPFLGEN